MWTYRVAALEQLNVPIRTGVEPTVERIRAFAPDLIVIATGGVPRDAPFPVKTDVPVLQAWDVLRRPELIPLGSSVTVVGGGMVGIETAECIAKRASHVAILEGQNVVAKEMARNNRWDVLLRLREANAQIVTGTPVVAIEGDAILCRSGQDIVRHPAGDVIVLAIGSRPLRDVSQLADAAGVPWVMAGDCNNVPGDFLTAIRDASMIAWAAEAKFPAGARQGSVRRDEPTEATGRINMKSHLAVLAAALLLAAPSAALAQAGSKGTVKVGVLLPLTGNTAWAGKTNRIAAAIAAEEVNAQDLAGGYKVELVFGDSQCEPRAAHDQAQRLISQEKVQLLIGEWCSSASIAVAQVANDEKIPLLVNISTADQIAGDAGPYAFQSSMQNRYSQQREAALLEKDFKFQTVAIIVENNDFGLTFRKNMVALMEKAGKKVVLDVTQDRSDTNWYATITRIPASKPDLVIVSISAVQAANFVKQYAEAGITTPLFSDYPPPPRIFERQVGLQAGKIGLVRAAFFVKSETNTPAQKEFVGEARGARAEGSQRGP